MKKIVSFCLYGDDLKYYVGAEKNIILNQKILPDWETYIYYSPSRILNGYVDKLKDLGANMINVDDLPINKNINYPMFWRYLSFIDNNITIIRDLDSRMSVRESEYINKWLDGDSNYFIIRDHPWHSQVPGGLFGFKDSSKSLLDFFVEFVSKHSQGWGTDQEMLFSFIEKIDKSDICYFGFDYQETYINRDDENFFIGIQLDENDKPIVPSATLALEFLKSLKL
jgi:hypothetical protein